MQFNEDQGKKLFSLLGIPVPRGGNATSQDQAADWGRQLGYPVMVKALVEVGRRGLAGNIQQAAGPAEVERVAARLLGSKLKGRVISAVRVEEVIAFEEELYVSVALDRARGRLLALFGLGGGMEVERSSDGEFATALIPMRRPFYRHHARDMVCEAGLNAKALVSAADVLWRLAEGARQRDLLLAEINPLFLLGSGEVVAGDAKVVLDDDAEYRQRGWLASVIGDGPTGEHSDRATGGSRLGLVRLQGNIGVVGGGAGLCMATMDAVVRAGGKPANFLDVGGGVTQGRIAESLRQVVSLGVEGILVNVYGGINNCATMARGIVEAVQSIPVTQALIVRMQGHFEEEGWTLLERAGVDVIKRGTTREAAERLVAGVRARNRGQARGDSAG